jgi:hypothetical protein
LTSGSVYLVGESLILLARFSREICLTKVSSPSDSLKFNCFFFFIEYFFLRFFFFDFFCFFILFSFLFFIFFYFNSDLMIRIYWYKIYSRDRNVVNFCDTITGRVRCNRRKRRRGQVNGQRCWLWPVLQDIKNWSALFCF